MKTQRFIDSRIAATAFRSVWQVGITLLLLDVLLGFSRTAVPKSEQMLKWQEQAGNPYMEIPYEEVPSAPVITEPTPPPVETPRDDEPPY